MHLVHGSAAVIGIALATAGSGATADQDALAPHMTVLGVTVEETSLLEAQGALGRADLRHNGGDAAGSAMAQCYAGPDGTVLVMVSNGEMGGGKTITQLQLLERARLADYSEGVDLHVPAEKQPRCAALKRLGRTTATAGGLRLGMGPDQVRRLLGEPVEEQPERLVFMGTATVAMSPGQAKAVAELTAGQRREDHLTRLRTLVVEFTRGKATAIRIHQVTTS